MGKPGFPGNWFYKVLNIVVKEGVSARYTLFLFRMLIEEISTTRSSYTYLTYERLQLLFNGLSERYTRSVVARDYFFSRYDATTQRYCETLVSSKV